MAKTLPEIYDAAVMTGHQLSQELLAEMIHPDPAGDMTGVRMAAAANLDALSDLVAELQIMRN